MDHRNILMWIEKEGPKRRLRKYTTGSKKTRGGVRKRAYLSKEQVTNCVSIVSV